jgi:hypothetical protein
MKRTEKHGRRRGPVTFFCVAVALLATTAGALAFAWARAPAAALSGAPQAKTEGGRAVKGAVQEVYRLGLRPGELLLESIREFLREEDIQDGAVLTGIGSLSECRLHWPLKPEHPPVDRFGTFEGALEITGLQGIIADGEPHLHMTVVQGGDARVMGGHVEEGCKVLYLAEITIARFSGPAMTRRPDEHGVKLLEKK